MSVATTNPAIVAQNSHKWHINESAGLGSEETQFTEQGVDPRALLGGLYKGAATTENFWRFLKNLTIELPYDPAMSLIGIRPKGLKIEARTDVYTRTSAAALFRVAKR